MASSRRTSKTRRSSRTRKQLNKKQSPEQSKQKEAVSTANDDIVVEVVDDDTVCSTPKGQKFRIPEISTCPPAPMKKRVLTNYSLRKSLSFFSPPDLDAFFSLALQDASVPLVC